MGSRDEIFEFDFEEVDIEDELCGWFSESENPPGQLSIDLYVDGEGISAFWTFDASLNFCAWPYADYPYLGDKLDAESYLAFMNSLERAIGADKLKAVARRVIREAKLNKERQAKEAAQTERRRAKWQHKKAQLAARTPSQVLTDKGQVQLGNQPIKVGPGLGRLSAHEWNGEGRIFVSRPPITRYFGNSLGALMPLAVWCSLGRTPYQIEEEDNKRFYLELNRLDPREGWRISSQLKIIEVGPRDVVLDQNVIEIDQDGLAALTLCCWHLSRVDRKITKILDKTKLRIRRTEIKIQAIQTSSQLLPSKGIIEGCIGLGLRELRLRQTLMGNWKRKSTFLKVLRRKLGQVPWMYARSLSVSRRPNVFALNIERSNRDDHQRAEPVAAGDAGARGLDAHGAARRSPKILHDLGRRPRQ